MASATGATQEAEGEVASFYGALWSEAQTRRREIAIGVEAAMVIAWFLVRTVADVDSRVYLIWLLAAGALALVAPKSGLVVLIATSVFFEPDSLARTIAPRELIVLPLALGVLVQIALDRFRWRPGLWMWLGLLLVAGTGLGVVHTFRVFDQDRLHFRHIQG